MLTIKDLRLDHFNLPLWELLKVHIDGQIENCHILLETNRCSHEDSQFLRGKIVALREILALEKAPASSTAGAMSSAYRDF